MTGEMLQGAKKRQEDPGQQVGREEGITSAARGLPARCGQVPGSCWEGRNQETSPVSVPGCRWGRLMLSVGTTGLGPSWSFFVHIPAESWVHRA